LPQWIDPNGSRTQQQQPPNGHDEQHSTRQLPDGRTAHVQPMLYGKGRINVENRDNWRNIDDSY